ncbi:MAG: hypothetical protein ACK5V0_08260 [Alphaproteobacteria bacterium]
MKDQITRMLADAEARLHDASLLDGCASRASDAPALLRVLALEVLLKAAQALESGRYTRTHDYACLWRSIGSNGQASVLQHAEQSIPGCLLGKDIDLLLRDWAFVFTRSRYYFELYEKYTLEEQEELGRLWIALGSPEAEAEVRYHPREIRALCAGLIAYLTNAA